MLYSDLKISISPPCSKTQCPSSMLPTPTSQCTHTLLFSPTPLAAVPQNFRGTSGPAGGWGITSDCWGPPQPPVSVDRIPSDASAAGSAHTLRPWLSATGPLFFHSFPQESLPGFLDTSAIICEVQGKMKI